MGNESYDEINNQHMGSRFDPNHQPNLRQKQHVNGTPKTSLSSQQAQRRNKNQMNHKIFKNGTYNPNIINVIDDSIGGDSGM